MIRLRCLGPVQIEGPETADPGAVVAQPKRLALLAVLALSEAGGLEGRDALVGMFWPESDESSARGSLRQALRYLRRSLGDEVLVTRGRSWVGVNRERVACDVWEFERRLDAGDREGALELYEGELLQGLEVRGVTEFEQWLVVRRRQLALRAAAAAGELAEEAASAGDGQAAVEWARRARDINPADEEAVRRLMELQLRTGDRAGALRTYELLEGWLDAEFDAVPSIRTRELADRARGGAPAVDGAGPASADAAAGAADRQAGDATTPAPTPTADPAPVSRRLRRLYRAESGAARVAPRAVPTPSARRRWRGPAVAAVLLVALGAGMAHTLGVGGAGPAPTDRYAADRVAVRPFEVNGPSASLSFMREGMAEIFASVFTGEAAPRAEPAGDADATAPGPEARWTVSGSIMGDDRQVYLRAALTDAAGVRPPRRTSVSGPADSIYALSRELAERLLALHNGAPPEEAALLARTSPAALRAYLAGREAHRRNRYEDADRHFNEALRFDSVFAQAAVGLVETHLAAPWLRGHAFEWALPLAFRLRHRLGPADRHLVTAVAGPHYPLASTQAEHFEAWEEAVIQAPERAAIWYQWGDALYHIGPFIGIADARERARGAFERTLQVDSSYLLPLIHLVELATEAGDVPGASAYLRRFTSEPHDTATAHYLRWRIALAADDPEGRRRALEAAGTDVGSLGAILRAAQFLGDGLDDARAIARIDRNSWSAPVERWRMLFDFHAFALNRGRATEARRIAQAMTDVAPTPHNTPHLLIRDAIHSGGDPEAAESAARKIAGAVDLTRPHDPAARPEQIADVCVLESWRAHRGRTDGLRRAVRWLRDPAMHPAEEDARPRRWCADYLEGILARDVERHLVPEALDRLPDLVGEGVGPPGVGAELLQLLLADLRVLDGDPEGALAALRLRQSITYSLAPRLRREGRLAAMMGDTAAARAAYTHYLAVRDDPEPRLRPEVDSVRAELDALGPPPPSPGPQPSGSSQYSGDRSRLGR